MAQSQLQGWLVKTDFGSADNSYLVWVKTLGQNVGVLPERSGQLSQMLHLSFSLGIPEGAQRLDLVTVVRLEVPAHEGDFCVVSRHNY